MRRCFVWDIKTSVSSKIVSWKPMDIMDNNNPDYVKYEVAKEQGITLKKGNNGDLTSRQAGKVGGSIGGSMVKEMINIAKEQMKK